MLQKLSIIFNFTIYKIIILLLQNKCLYVQHSNFSHTNFNHCATKVPKRKKNLKKSIQVSELQQTTNLEAGRAHGRRKRKFNCLKPEEKQFLSCKLS